MAESDEEKVLLEDDSMDEMHELEDDMVASIDTNASPAKSSVTSARRRFEETNEYDGKQSDSDESELFQASSGSDSDDSNSRDDLNTLASPRIRKPLGRKEPHGDSDFATRVEEENDDDEPPEIPGSPLRSTVDDDITSNGRGRTTANILTIHHGDDSDNNRDSDYDDYESKETEAPRAMEFQTSSSSSDSEREADSDDDEVTPHRVVKGPSRITQESPHERPKTAAKELALYRDVVPTQYYEQIVQDAPTSPMTPTPATTVQKQTTHDQPRSVQQRIPSQTTQSAATKYAVRVPREIEDLFQYVDAYTPEVVDIPTRLQPFIPEYVPVIGLPFDGIQIPRPDNKSDVAGIAFVREPCAESSTAELELLLAARAKTQRRKRQLVTGERVHSIEDACHRPRDIDHWIASVAKVQASKPPLQVLYKKAMPSETSLMELWSEEFEVFLASQPPLAISKMDLDVSETLRVVCGILDIPVYDGLHIHSLYALFSLYHEVVAYEKEMLSRTSGDKGS